jgi:hypothetical protein
MNHKDIKESYCSTKGKTNCEQISTEGIKKWNEGVKKNYIPDLIFLINNIIELVEIKSPADNDIKRLCTQIENQYNHCHLTLKKEFNANKCYSVIVICETSLTKILKNLHLLLKTINGANIKLYTYKNNPNKCEFTEFDLLPKHIQEPIGYIQKKLSKK